jgi:hypothetical protein
MMVDFHCIPLMDTRRETRTLRHHGDTRPDETLRSRTVSQSDEVVLGEGRIDGVEWQLVLLPGPRPPLGQGRVMIRSGPAGGGHSLSGAQPAPLGGVGFHQFGPPDSTALFTYGEVQDGYQVTAELRNGDRIDCPLIRTTDSLGYNMYIAKVTEQPVRVIAVGPDGEQTTFDLH